MPAISIPTTAALSSSQRLPPSDASASKLLSRLTRSSLISLALDWLDDRNQDLCEPYLAGEGGEEEEEDAQTYPPARSLEELREYYIELQAQKGSKREVVDRIIEGDWRNGLSLYQLAMADMEHFYDHPTSHKWTAMKVVKLSSSGLEDSTDLDCIPRFHPPTFLQNLQHEVLPDIKAHYNLDSHPRLPITILRMCFFSSPYNTSLALAGPHAADGSRTVLVAFPTASPHVFISMPQQSTEKRTTKRSDTLNVREFLQDAIPRAFSRPRERYVLHSTTLSARTLESLLDKRGQARGNAAKGGWSIYAEDKVKDGRRVTDTPLNQIPIRPTSDISQNTSQSSHFTLKRKRNDDNVDDTRKRRVIAQSRFGNSAKPEDKTGIERLDIRIVDGFPSISRKGKHNSTGAGSQTRADAETLKKRPGRRSAIEKELEQARTEANETKEGREEEEEEAEEEDAGWRPEVRITFQGSHVFAGVRELVELGVVDGQAMPGWMTGEESVSLGIVKDGRILGHRGSGV